MKRNSHLLSNHFKPKSPSSDEVDQFAIGFDGSSTGLIIGIWHIHNVLHNPP